MCNSHICKYMDLLSYDCKLFRQKKCFMLKCIYQKDCSLCLYQNTNYCRNNVNNGNKKAQGIV